MLYTLPDELIVGPVADCLDDDIQVKSICSLGAASKRLRELVVRSYDRPPGRSGPSACAELERVILFRHDGFVTMRIGPASESWRGKTSVLQPPARFLVADRFQYCIHAIIYASIRRLGCWPRGARACGARRSLRTARCPRPPSPSPLPLLPADGTACPRCRAGFSAHSHVPGSGRLGWAVGSPCSPVAGGPTSSHALTCPPPPGPPRARAPPPPPHRTSTTVGATFSPTSTAP